jgi:hypothetical protein
VLPRTAASFYLVLAGLNNDGNRDLLGQTGGPGQFYRGNGDGTFAAPLLTTAIPYGTVTADFNLDGKLDLAMTTAQARQDGNVQGITITLGVGDGTFVGYFGIVLSGASIGQPLAGDFNADGKPDVAVRRGSPARIIAFPPKREPLYKITFTGLNAPRARRVAVNQITRGNVIGSQESLCYSPLRRCWRPCQPSITNSSGSACSRSF